MTESIFMSDFKGGERMNVTFNVIGKVLYIPYDLFIVEVNVDDDLVNRTYIVKDVEKFKERWLDAHSQEITRVVFYRDDAAVIYTRGSAFNCFGIKENVKNYLIERFGDTKDEKLKIALSIVAGSDTKDFKTFRYVTKIYDFFEISKELGEKGIQAGFGFPGQAVGLILAERETLFGGKEKIVIIQEIHSYMEGYAVEHKVIDKRMFDVMNIFNEKIKNFFEEVRE